jgi:hypothetical protein
MSLYTLINASNTIGALPPTPIIRPVRPDQQQSLALLSGNLLDPTLPITPPSSQSFQLTVAGTGAVSASAQMYGSNDGKNWATIGSPITANGTTTATVVGLGSVPFAFFGALLTAITGTNALATVTMSC